jgi:hypothetical protein
MRLLEINHGYTFSLTKDLIGDDEIPAYAILSHTWQAGQEVTFDDLINNTGHNKAGYIKLKFCAQQAERDGLRNFWVDTCCTIQSHHRCLCPTKGVAYAAEDGGRTCIAFQYICIIISLTSNFSFENL